MLQMEASYMENFRQILDAFEGSLAKCFRKNFVQNLYYLFNFNLVCKKISRSERYLVFDF